MSDEVRVPLKVSLPLDNGYLRRECPVCLRQFKWWHGRHPDRPADVEDPEEYHCPYCDATAGPRNWLTQAQAELIRSAGLQAAQELIANELKDSIREINRSGLIKAELRTETIPESTPLNEPDDMIAVIPPCHRYEPLKIEESWKDPVHCLVCGQAFEPSGVG